MKFITIVLAITMALSVVLSKKDHKKPKFGAHKHNAHEHKHNAHEHAYGNHRMEDFSFCFMNFNEQTCKADKCKWNGKTCSK